MSSQQHSEPEPSSPSTDRTRRIILVLTVVVGFLVASIPLFATVFIGDDVGEPGAPSATSQSASVSSDATPERTDSGAIQVAHRVACPTPAQGAAVSPEAELRDVRLPCLTEGNAESDTSLAQQLAGKPTVINVWAWWCAPCREELPVIQQLAKDNPQWNVVGVHLDAKGQAGVDLLQQLDVTELPSYQDSNHTFDAATGIPKVVPVTVVYRPDGTRAGVFARTFDSAAEMKQLIQEAL